MPAYNDIVKLVSILLAMRDPWDHHGQGVASLAVRFSRALGMTESEIEMMEYGAFLHDIGKLRVRSPILNLTRKLTDDEYAEMQLHSALGWAIVEQAGYSPTILDVVRYHHEKWDGTGYPDGLRGEQIPLSARIAHICDVYQSMLSERSYRKAYSHDFVMAYMEKGRGRFFDPKLLDVFFDKVVGQIGKAKS
jgi:putative nucleotidyltransferase with HDIG domain